MGLSTFAYTWKMAWRNVWRSRRRSFSAFFTLTCGLVAAIATYGLARGISRQMVRSVVELRTGHLQVHATDRSQDLPLSATFALPATPAPPGVAWTVAPRIHTAGLVSIHRPQVARLAPLAARLAPLAARLKKTGNATVLSAGRMPEKPCDVLVSAAHADAVGLFLMHPIGRECPQLTVTGALAGPADDGLMTLYSGLVQLEDFLPEPEIEIDEDDLDALEKLSVEKPVVRKAAPTHAPKGPALDTPLLFTATRDLPVRVFAVDPAAEGRFALARALVQGRWLQAQDGPVVDAPERDLPASEAEFADVPVVIGETLARRLGIRLHDRVGLDVFDAEGVPRDFWGRVVGVLSTQVPELDAQAAFVPLAWAVEQLGFVSPDGRPRVHELAILLEHAADLPPASAHLRRILPPELVLRTWNQLAPGMQSAVAFQEGLVFMILSIVILMAMLGTLNSFLMSILERTWEFGVLKAIGLGPGALFGMILLEATVVSSAALAVGTTLGWLLCSHLSTTGLDLSFFFADGFTFAGVLLRPVWHAELVWQTIVVPAALLWTAAVGAALWPAWRVARMSARSALSEEK
ncbi:MAG: hypothetical protein CVU65_12740 [Deltaproteobacteria bacterium HGW-Deltaproteobacteria-22]|nr:MAG: hypothetical protein CVU65_12740 [Deltaproteobacteria bacterium HGW-Deltaproteobacteria-22]